MNENVAVVETFTVHKVTAAWHHPGGFDFSSRFYFKFYSPRVTLATYYSTYAYTVEYGIRMAAVCPQSETPQVLYVIEDP